MIAIFICVEEIFQTDHEVYRAVQLEDQQQFQTVVYLVHLDEL